MLIALMVSLVFFSAGTIVLSGGIFTLQGNPKVAANKLFFVLTIALAIWSFGMAGATVAADAATSEAFRRIASIGWGTFYAFLLHFILDITGKPALLKMVVLFVPVFAGFIHCFFVCCSKRNKPAPVQSAANKVWLVQCAAS